MILLYSDSTDSTVTTDGRLYNDAYAPRRYQFAGHFLELDGSDLVAAHDVEIICNIPGYRLVSAQEQNAYMAAKRKAAKLEEKAAPVALPPSVEPAPEAPVVSAPSEVSDALASDESTKAAASPPAAKG